MGRQSAYSKEEQLRAVNQWLKASHNDPDLSLAAFCRGKAYSESSLRHWKNMFAGHTGLWQPWREQ